MAMAEALRIGRRDALWAAKAITADRPLPLFAGDIDGEGLVEPAALLPRMTAGEEVVEDYVATRLSLRAHPVGLLRPLLTPGAALRRPAVPMGVVPDFSRLSFTRGNPD